MGSEVSYAAGYAVEKDVSIDELIPTGHHCLVKPDKVEEKTAGGLWKPDQAIQKQRGNMQIGTIVALGPQCFKAFDDGEPWAAVEDRVVYAKYGGKVFNYLEEKDTEEHALRLLNDEDILLVIKSKVKTNKQKGH